MHNLWECLPNELIRAATYDGFTYGLVETEAMFLDIIKKLAVQSQNTLIGQVKFLNLGHDRNKSINSYVLRLLGAAMECKFEVPSQVDARGWSAIQT